MTQNCINSSNPFLQVVTTSLATEQTCTTTIPGDNTIPQNTEGDEILSLAITPKFSNSILEIIFSGSTTANNTGFLTSALFQDSTAGALAANCSAILAGNALTTYLKYSMTSGTTSSTTFKIRMGGSAGDCYVNGDSTGAQLMGGVANTTLTIFEYL